MIDLNAMNEWQYRDPETGLVFPWYTKPALDEIVMWNLSDKVVFEYGCGASTLWWRKKALRVYGVDINREYAETVNVDWQIDQEHYIISIANYGLLFDIIIIDGSWRDECFPFVLDYIKPGGKIIFDNWMQPSVCCQTHETRNLLLRYTHKIFKQPGHPDWQTAIFTI